MEKMKEMEETLVFVQNEERQQEIKKFIKDGLNYRCIGCNRVYKQKPQKDLGHCSTDMCRYCGCDLFQELEKVSCLNVQIKPVDGVLIFKEHNAKYCMCEVGKVQRKAWTGKAEDECHARFEPLEEKEDRKEFRCLTSGFRIVILKSTKEELENPDARGSTYHRWPGV